MRNWFTWEGQSRPSRGGSQSGKEARITIQTYYRWRKEYGGLKLDQAKRLKELERRNGKLKGWWQSCRWLIASTCDSRTLRHNRLVHCIPSPAIA